MAYFSKIYWVKIKFTEKVINKLFEKIYGNGCILIFISFETLIDRFIKNLLNNILCGA